MFKSRKIKCSCFYFLENACGMDFTTDAAAPPLPPRTLHKPLERCHALGTPFTPPVVLRQNKPRKIQKLEDTFNFELIDTDEDYKSFGKYFFYKIFDTFFQNKLIIFQEIWYKSLPKMF